MAPPELPDVEAEQLSSWPVELARGPGPSKISSEPDRCLDQDGLSQLRDDHLDDEAPASLEVWKAFRKTATRSSWVVTFMIARSTPDTRA